MKSIDLNGTDLFVAIDALRGSLRIANDTGTIFNTTREVRQDVLDKFFKLMSSAKFKLQVEEELPKDGPYR